MIIQEHFVFLLDLDTPLGSHSDLDEVEVQTPAIICSLELSPFEMPDYCSCLYYCVVV